MYYSWLKYGLASVESVVDSLHPGGLAWTLLQWKDFYELP